MNRPRIGLLLLAMAAIGAVLAAACGGDNAGAKTTTVPAGTTTTAANSPAPAAPAWKDKKITFAVVPSEDTAGLIEKNKILKEYLEKALPGLTVDLFTGPSYAVVIEAAKSEKVDFIVFGPFSYVIAKDTGAKIESALATQADPNTKPGYWSTMYVRGDSGFTKLEDLKGKEDTTPIAFVDPGSTSGYLAPNNMLKMAGLDLAKIQKNQLLAGGHDKTALAVYQGKTKVGVSYEQMLYDLCKKGLINRVVDKAEGGYLKGDCQKDGASTDTKDDLIIVKKFLLPASPVAYRTTLDPKISSAVIDALFNWKKTDKASAVKWFASIGDSKADTTEMVRYTDSEYGQIRQMCLQPELKDICPKK